MWACVLRRNGRCSWEQVGAEAPVWGSWFLGFWVLTAWGHGPSGFLSVGGEVPGISAGAGPGPRKEAETWEASSKVGWTFMGHHIPGARAKVIHGVAWTQSGRGRGEEAEKGTELTPGAAIPRAVQGPRDWHLC